MRRRPRVVNVETNCDEMRYRLAERARHKFARNARTRWRTSKVQEDEWTLHAERWCGSEEEKTNFNQRWHVGHGNGSEVRATKGPECAGWRNFCVCLCVGVVDVSRSIAWTTMFLTGDFRSSAGGERQRRQSQRGCVTGEWSSTIWLGRKPVRNFMFGTRKLRVRFLV